MLRRNHDCRYALWHSVVRVLHGNLALGVRPEVGHLLSFLAYVGQRAHDEVRQVERNGHIVLRLVACVAEHHALVAGALVLNGAVVDAAVDVVALLVDGVQNAARVAVKLVFRLGIAYLFDSPARDGLQVDVLAAAHLARNDNLSGGNQCLHGYPRIGVVGQELVKYGVRNLVGYLVGMSFRH